MPPASTFYPETPAQHGQGAAMAGEDNELERIAAGIADDAAVDWKNLGRLDARAAATGEGLRELSQLAQVFRGVQLRPERSADGRVLFRFAGLDVLEKLGAGTQGEVYRAYDPMLDQNVALKLRRLDSDALSHQFLAEARRLARVRQANIVSVFGAAAQDGRVGLWTELVRGRTLAEQLAENGPMSPDEVAEIGVQLCRALAAVHRHGLTHGDLKAENVLRDVSGRIVLADFGAAREIDNARQFDTISGTRHYLAPELLAGDAASPACDQYSLGVLLYHLLTGTFPYDATDLDALREQQLSGRRASLRQLRPALPRALARVIDRALNTDPARRHAGVEVMAAALDATVRPRRVALLRTVLLAGVAASLALVAWLRPAPPALNVDLAFYRESTGQREQLRDGATVALGDRLRLEISASRPTWLYVFNDDGTAPTVLYPLAGLAPENPLSADTRWQLPGRDAHGSLSWQVDREADRETFVIVASTQALPLVEASIADWRRAQMPDTALVARGTGRLVPTPPQSSTTGAGLADLLSRVGCDAARSDVRCERLVFPHSRR